MNDTGDSDKSPSQEHVVIVTLTFELKSVHFDFWGLHTTGLLRFRISVFFNKLLY